MKRYTIIRMLQAAMPTRGFFYAGHFGCFAQVCPIQGERKSIKGALLITDECIAMRSNMTLSSVEGELVNEHEYPSIN